MGERIQPQDQVAEQNVLGAMLLSEQAIARVLPLLGGDAFYASRHQVLFDAIRDLAARGEPADLVTVRAALHRTGQLDQAGGSVYLAEILNSVATAANAEYYARLVADAATRRALIRTGTEITALGYLEDRDVEDLVTDAGRAVFELAGGQAKGKVGAAGRPVKTGYHDLDQLLGPLKAGNVLLVAALTSMGKTAFAGSVARNVSRGLGGQAPRPVAVVSYEMTAGELALRWLCAESGVPGDRIERLDIRDSDWPLMGHAVATLEGDPIFIADDRSLTAGQIGQLCRRLKSDLGDLGLVIVDYVQLVPYGGKKKDPREDEEITYTSRVLAASSGELGCPFLVLSQFNRGADKAGSRPSKAHLKGSGSLEQDAHKILFLHGDQAEAVREVIVDKNRGGRTGSAHLCFDRSLTRFENFIRPARGDWNLLRVAPGAEVARQAWEGRVKVSLPGMTSLGDALWAVWSDIEGRLEERERTGPTVHAWTDTGIGAARLFSEDPRSFDSAAGDCKACDAGVRLRYLDGVPTRLLCACDQADRWVDKAGKFLTLPWGTIYGQVARVAAPEPRTAAAGERQVEPETTMPLALEAPPASVMAMVMGPPDAQSGALPPEDEANMLAWQAEQERSAG